MGKRWTQDDKESLFDFVMDLWGQHETQPTSGNIGDFWEFAGPRLSNLLERELTPKGWQQAYNRLSKERDAQPDPDGNYQIEVTPNYAGQLRAIGEWNGHQIIAIPDELWDQSKNGELVLRIGHNDAQSQVC